MATAIAKGLKSIMAGPHQIIGPNNGPVIKPIGTKYGIIIIRFTNIADAKDTFSTFKRKVSLIGIEEVTKATKKGKRYFAKTRNPYAFSRLRANEKSNQIK